MNWKCIGRTWVDFDQIESIKDDQQHWYPDQNLTVYFKSGRHQLFSGSARLEMLRAFYEYIGVPFDAEAHAVRVPMSLERVAVVRQGERGVKSIDGERFVDLSEVDESSLPDNESAVVSIAKRIGADYLFVKDY